MEEGDALERRWPPDGSSPYFLHQGAKPTHFDPFYLLTARKDGKCQEGPVRQHNPKRIVRSRLGRIYARSLKRSPIRSPGNDGKGVAAHYCLLAPGRKPNISFLLSASPCVGPAHKGTQVGVAQMVRAVVSQVRVLASAVYRQSEVRFPKWLLIVEQA